jgi:dTMP kinase
MISPGRLIAFEGVDGAGKSTALARVADVLRARGVDVFLPRTGKEHASRPTRMIRQLTRDPRNLELDPRAELLLYCAREAQVLSELVRPALARGQTVLLDRSLLTPVVLGMARGLSRDECEGATKLAGAGLEPELTLVFDVHPRTSRLRKRLERIREHTMGEGGRKGLAGSALKERVRDAYAQIASARGYPLFHVERATRDELAARVVNVVLQGKAVGTGETALDAQPTWRVPAALSFAQALESLPLGDALFFADGLVAARALRASALDAEPELVAFTLDADDPLREAAAARSPEYALRGWVSRPLSGPSDLRLRWLERAPAAAIAALRYVHDAQSDSVRERYGQSQPDAVLGSLAGRTDDRGWQLRTAAWPDASDNARALSLVGCEGERANALRAELFETSPLLGLASLRGVHSKQGDAWLQRYAPHAPKLVLAALAGRQDSMAHALRQDLFECGREVIDTVRRLGDDPSFALRERAVERWPSTVAHSLLGLGHDARARALRVRCEQLGAGDVHVARRLALLDEEATAPTWASARSRERVAEVAA